MYALKIAGDKLYPCLTRLHVVSSHLIVADDFLLYRFQIIRLSFNLILFLLEF